MNLSSSTVAKIMDGVELASTLDVDGLIFDSKGVHGYDDDEAIMIADLGDYRFEFDTLGISGCPDLWKKLKLLSSRGDIAMTANTKVETVNEKEVELVYELVIKSKRLEYTHRCSDPRRITDIPGEDFKIKKFFSYDLTNDDLVMLAKGAATMGNRNVLINAADGEVVMTFSSEDGATMDYTVEAPLKQIGDQESFKMVIEARKMVKIFKLALAQHEFITVNMLVKNIIYLTISDIDIFIMTEV